jgi:phosphoglycolate phosphatase
MNVLFDLDGTLIDSIEGIQNSFNIAFESVYQTKNTVCIESLIGPPIQDILMSITGEKNGETIEKFVTTFKTNYDTSGYKLCSLYNGMENVLQKLAFDGNSLFICTNKRTIPTFKIIKHLAIEHYFHKVFSIDSEEVKVSNKGELVKYILTSQSLETKKTILIGDTKSDADASLENNLTFIFASYGFGKLADVPYTINKPSDIFNYIN